MEEKLEGLKGVECQIDDVLVYGETQQIHDERLQVVLKRFAQSNITLNLDNCELAYQKLK